MATGDHKGAAITTATVDAVAKVAGPAKTRKTGAYDRRDLVRIALMLTKAFPTQAGYAHGGQPSCSAIARAIAPIGDEAKRVSELPSCGGGFAATTLQDALVSANKVIDQCHSDASTTVIVLGALVKLASGLFPEPSADAKSVIAVQSDNSAIAWAKAISAALPAGLKARPGCEENALKALVLEAKRTLKK